MADIYSAQNGKLYVAVSGVVPNSMKDMPTFAVSDNTAKIAIGAYNYLIDNVLVVGAATTGITVGSGTITAAKYATIKLEISEAGTITAGTKSASHTTAAQALADLSDLTSGSMSMGYYVIKSATTTVTTLGTSKLSETAAAGATAMITFYEEFDRAFVADFRGNVSMTNAVDTLDWVGQDIVPSGSIATGMTCELNISEMIFRPDSLRKFWGATHSPTASLKGKADSNADSWLVDADMRPITLQLLFMFTNSETGNDEQVYCPAGKAMQMPMTFGSKDYVVQDMGFKLFINDDREFFYYYRDKG
jgi:hypothetical protein